MKTRDFNKKRSRILDILGGKNFLFKKWKPISYLEKDDMISIIIKNEALNKKDQLSKEEKKLLRKYNSELKLYLL